MTTVIKAPGEAAAERAGAGRPDGGAKRGSDGMVLNVFSHGFLALWAVLIILPLIWLALGSFKTDAQIGGSALSWPANWHLDAFGRAWDKGIGDYFAHTLIVMVFSVPLTMLLGSMAAYVLARYPFAGNRFIYYFFVSGAMFPVFLALVPLFFMVKRFDMLNTYQGLILVYVAYSMPFTVFFMHSFFRTLPAAVHEAAVIDGASHTRIFFQVMVPMAKPGLISVGIFNILGQWNQYILPSVLMQPQTGSDPERYLLTQGLIQLQQQQGYATDLPVLFAGVTIAMIPMLVVYLSFQRQIQAGLTSATLK
ncbi:MULTISPECIES: carbohydrate ABC transporter permease [Streptomyces]|uniref:carbohydrate ABC transporter permease n=1 Tax=Streptomyces TaxID=1883 RepID=UPI00017E9868|nr:MULTISPECIES: carbohydrate ABC transporter permease [Streptomyces]EDX25885.1 transmembrane protein [Streptomyces sp. Mg1]WBY22601.1 carbohydrate ABC transporter permease [Streptomyces goshikiensis]WSS01417.1 carbohydrate ABC transporter permease [Streptomyces goshikiensis]WSX97532.1 carbohydrate ABC transporter permease [Streptomyces goshikiensis]